MRSDLLSRLERSARKQLGAETRVGSPVDFQREFRSERLSASVGWFWEHLPENIRHLFTNRASMFTQFAEGCARNGLPVHARARRRAQHAIHSQPQSPHEATPLTIQAREVQYRDHSNSFPRAKQAQFS